MRLLLLAVLLLSGCALVPDTARVEAQHTSHLTQHEPFTNHPTNYSYDIVGVVAHWNLPARFAIDVAEGYNMERKQYGQCGALDGGHEVFTARIAYTFWTK